MQYNAKRENDVLRFGNNINDDKKDKIMVILTD